jgi:hypothetical protein
VQPLIKIFVGIFFLRAKPQDVPASSALLLLSIVLVIVSGVVSMFSTVGELTQGIVVSLLDVALTFAMVTVILKVMNLSSRLTQTATAIFGTGVIVNLVSLPVVWLWSSGFGSSGFRLLGGLLYFVLLVWSLVIMGHILRHSFNLHLSSGILIAIGYFLVINNLVQSLFPAG